jgi:hypothetical protein
MQLIVQMMCKTGTYALVTNPFISTCYKYDKVCQTRQL